MEGFGFGNNGFGNNGFGNNGFGNNGFGNNGFGGLNNTVVEPGFHISRLHIHIYGLRMCALWTLKMMERGTTVSFPTGVGFELEMLSIMTAVVHVETEKVCRVLRNLITAYNHATQNGWVREQSAAAQALRKLVPLGLNAIVVARTRIGSLGAELEVPAHGNHYRFIETLTNAIGGVVERNTIEPLMELLNSLHQPSRRHNEVAALVAAHGGLEVVNLEVFYEAQTV